MVFGMGVEPFADTHPALVSLTEHGLRLGVVSNSWPSLDRRYAALGLRHFVDAFVISAQLGCLKPDPRMFRAQLETLSLMPREVLFVDDWHENVAVAIGCGMLGVVLARDGVAPPAGLARTPSLTERSISRRLYARDLRMSGAHSFGAQLTAVPMAVFTRHVAITGG